MHLAPAILAGLLPVAGGMPVDAMMPGILDVRLQAISRQANEKGWPFAAEAGTLACVRSLGIKVVIFLPDPKLADDSVEPRLNQVTMALKSIVDDPVMRGEIDGFIRAYNETIISDRQMSLPALVVQALVEIHFSQKMDLMGDDARDFTMKGLADATRAIAADIDPDIKIHPRTVSHILSEDLGLPRRKTCSRTRRAALEYVDGELFALMKRYGIDPPVDADGAENGAKNGKSEG